MFYCFTLNNVVQHIDFRNGCSFPSSCTLEDMVRTNTDLAELLLDSRQIWKIQSTLVISNSLISNNRLSRSENLVPVLTQRSTNRQQNIVEKRRYCSLGAISPPFHNIFNISLTGVKLKIHSVNGGCSINCFPQCNIIEIIGLGMSRNGIFLPRLLKYRPHIAGN